jgi:hypothetical protein
MYSLTLSLPLPGLAGLAGLFIAWPHVTSLSPLAFLIKSFRTVFNFCEARALSIRFRPRVSTIPLRNVSPLTALRTLLMSGPTCPRLVRRFCRDSWICKGVFPLPFMVRIRSSSLGVICGAMADGAASLIQDCLPKHELKKVGRALCFLSQCKGEHLGKQVVYRWRRPRGFIGHECKKMT